MRRSAVRTGRRIVPQAYLTCGATDGVFRFRRNLKGQLSQRINADLQDFRHRQKADTSTAGLQRLVQRLSTKK
jgi:hypothetical protein